MKTPHDIAFIVVYHDGSRPFGYVGQIKQALDLCVPFAQMAKTIGVMPGMPTGATIHEIEAPTTELSGDEYAKHGEAAELGKTVLDWDFTDEPPVDDALAALEEARLNCQRCERGGKGVILPQIKASHRIYGDVPNFGLPAAGDNGVIDLALGNPDLEDTRYQFCIVADGNTEPCLADGTTYVRMLEQGIANANTPKAPLLVDMS